MAAVALEGVAAVASSASGNLSRPLYIYVVNTRDNGRGGLEPNLPAGTTWVGDLYTKNAGAVSKYVLKTQDHIVGLPGVFGPITEAQIQAAIDADGGTLKGWKVPHMVAWSVGTARSNEPRVGL